MIIRRRTYGMRKEFSYGYFMFNIHEGDLSSRNTNRTKLVQNIYTSCLQEEAPVGSFPKSYRSEDALMDGYERCVGCNDGNTIVVWTPKRCFRSLNGGITWTQLGTTGASGGWSIVGGISCYMDSSAYYMVMAYSEQGSSGYKNIVVYKYTISTGAITSTTVKTILKSTRWNCSGDYSSYTVNDGSFYMPMERVDNQISNNGHIIIWDWPGSYCPNNYDACFVLDIPHATYSASWYWSTSTPTTPNQTGGAFIKDNTTYGYFLQPYFSGTIYSSGAGQYLDNISIRKIALAAVTYNGQSLTVSDVTSSIKNKISTYINQALSTNVGGWGAWNMYFCSNTVNYNNKIIICISFKDQWIVSMDQSYNNVQYIGKASDYADYNGGYDWTAFPSITPDNKYLILMGMKTNLMYSLTTNSFKQAYEFKDLEPEIETDLVDNGWDLGYMLPRTTFI